MSDQDKEDGDPDGPLWYTFTFPLPFGLGLNSSGTEAFTIGLTPDMLRLPAGSSIWRDPSDTDDFGSNAVIRMRFYTRETDAIALVPEHVDDVTEAFYGHRLLEGMLDRPSYGKDGASYEQWVSLETQGARTRVDSADDPAYAFHRCLWALNIFLTGYSLAFGFIDVYPIETHDIGRVMVRGVRQADGNWGHAGPIFMHIKHWSIPTERRALGDLAVSLEAAVATVIHQHPYIPMKLWFDRAQRAGRQGDQAGRVVSMQTAVESLFFTTWTMTMVDDGRNSEQIEHLTRTLTTFESLFNSKMPRLLGGDWDRTKPDTPAGIYWNRLYILRNAVVHSGYYPNEPEAEDAEAGFRAIRKHINDRLWRRRRDYPRTVLARIGEPAKQGYTNTAWFDQWRKAIEQSEPRYSWWQPYDIAGRNPQ